MRRQCGMIWGLGVVLGLAGCENPTSIHELGRAAIERGHLTELELDGDTIYVADSNSGFQILRVGEAGSLDHVGGWGRWDGRPRCTSIALHAATSTLFCAAHDADDPGVYAFDVSDPAEPVLRSSVNVGADLHVRDIHVLGERLYLARFLDGLWVADIAEDGSLGPLRATAIEGNARMLDAHGDRLVLLMDGGRLLVLERAGGELVQLHAVDVPGPPIGLRVRDGRALVAQGSLGVGIVDLEQDPPRLVGRLEPPAVVTSADLDGDLAAVGSLDGTFLYDLAQDPPRLVGFHPSRSVLLDVEFGKHGELFVSDWAWVERFSVDPTLPSPFVDVEPGLYLAPGEDARVVLRNPGSSELELVLRLGTKRVAKLELAAGATDVVVVPSADIDARLRSKDVVDLTVRSKRADGQRFYGIERTVNLVRRPSEHDPSQGRPAPNDEFTPLSLADQDGRMFELPGMGGAFRAVWLTPDCAAMFPELQDLGWLARQGLAPDGTVVIIADHELAESGYLERWGLDAAVQGAWGRAASDEVNAANWHLGDPLYGAFEIRDIERVAPYPTDYQVDAEGLVIRVDRAYRGLHVLE